MNLAIRYDTEYRYDQPVSFSTHLYRVLPRVDLHTTVQRTVFVTNAGAAVQFRRDLFDNVVASCFYPGTFDRLQIHVELDLTIAEKNPFDFLLAEHALEFPFRYTGQEARVLGPYLQRTPGAARIPFWLPEPQPTLAALTALNTAIYQNIHYTRRDEGEAYTPEETLRHGCGACRDFAVLLADGLRGAGIAARLASGYLWEDSTAEARRAEGALHAWT
jgi:transglutaminase-like putative cysteine protease